jgi:flagellin
MTISVQNYAASLLTLETPSAAAEPDGAAPARQPLAAPPPGQDGSAAAILDLSAGAQGAAAGLTGPLSAAVSASDAAVSAGSSIGDLLGRMRQTALAASDPSLGQDERQGLDQSFKSDLAQIQTTIGQAEVGGVNLIDGSAPGAPQAGGDGGATSLLGTDLTATGPLIGLSADAGLSDPTAASGLADQLAGAIGRVGNAVDQLEAQGQAVTDHLSLVSQAASSPSPDASDAGSGLDGVRLLALQLRQDLASSSGPLVSQAPQSILALFR